MPGNKKREGFSLIEALVAVILLLVAMTITVRVVDWVAHGRRSLDRRMLAIHAAANALERLTLNDPQGNSASPRMVEELEELEDSFDGEIEVERVPEEVDGIRLDRVTVTILVHGFDDQPGAPVRLTTWIAPSLGHGRANPREDGP